MHFVSRQIHKAYPNSGDTLKTVIWHDPGNQLVAKASVGIADAHGQKRVSTIYWVFPKFLPNVKGFSYRVGYHE